MRAWGEGWGAAKGVGREGGSFVTAFSSFPRPGGRSLLSEQHNGREHPRQVLPGRAEPCIQVRIKVNELSSSKNRREFQRNEVDRLCLPFPKCSLTCFVHLPWVLLIFFFLFPSRVVSRVVCTNECKTFHLGGVEVGVGVGG